MNAVWGVTGFPLKAFVSGAPASQRPHHISLGTPPCVTCLEPREPREGAAYLGAGVVVSGCPDRLGVAPVTDLGQSKTSENLTGEAQRDVRREASSSVPEGPAGPALRAGSLQPRLRAPASSRLADSDGTASPCHAGRHATRPARAAGQTG